MQKITDDLIEKFLRGDCTKEEAAMVASYLRSNPEEHYLLNEYTQADGEAPLPEGYREEMLAFITEKTVEGGMGAGRTEEGDGMIKGDGMIAGEMGKRGSRLLPLWRWAAAAAVVILVWQGWSYMQTKKEATGPQLAQYNAPSAD